MSRQEWAGQLKVGTNKQHLEVKLGKDLSINNNKNLIAGCIDYTDWNWLAEEHCLYAITTFWFFPMTYHL